MRAAMLFDVNVSPIGSAVFVERVCDLRNISLLLGMCVSDLDVPGSGRVPCPRGADLA
jgi:hypothetical protein